MFAFLCRRSQTLTGYEVTRTQSGAIYYQRKGGAQNLLLQFHLQSTVWRAREAKVKTPLNTSEVILNI